MTDVNPQPISIPFTEGDERALRVTFGPGRIRIAPGGAEAWVTGVYTDPSNAFPLKITQQGATVRIAQAYSIPRTFKVRSELDLQLGNAKPYALTLEAGANEESSCDIGGLPITNFDARHGAGEITFDVSAPNPVEMQRFHLASGAADVKVRNLANANVAEVHIEGGAASFKLDFGGALRRDANARISTGMAAVELIVPSSTAAKIVCHAVLGKVDAGDGFVTREGGYWTMAAVAGDTPVLTIDASVALGEIKLRAEGG